MNSVSVREESYSNQFLAPIRAALFAQPQVFDEAERQLGPFELTTFNPSARVSSQTLSQLLALVYEKTGQRDIALKAGSLIEVGQFGAISYYLLACSTVFEIFNHLVKVHELISAKSEVYRIDMQPDHLGLAVTPNRVANLPELLRYEQLIASLVSLVSHIGGPDCRPETIELPFEPPPESALHESFFNCSVQYHKPLIKIVYAKRWVGRQLPNANPTMKEVLKPEIARYLSQHRAGGSLMQQVHDLLSSMTSLQGVTQTRVAQQMHMSESTLKRRLAEEDATFKSLVTSFRQTRTLSLLGLEDSSYEAIAVELGFSERASFERAFKNWYGLTPARFRNLTKLCKLSTDYVDLAHLDELPGAPSVCRDVVQILNEEDYELSDLLKVLEMDPVITGKLMGLANSAFFGSQEIHSLEQAVVKMGGQRVMNLALAMLANEALGEAQEAGLNLGQFWAESLCLAWWSNEIALALQRHEPSEAAEDQPKNAYLIGLLAHIGLLLLAALRPKEMATLEPILRECQNLSEQDASEKRALGINRFEASAVLLAHWSLPGPVVKTLQGVAQLTGAQKRTRAVKCLLAAIVLERNQDQPDDALYDLFEKMVPKVLSPDDIKALIAKSRTVTPQLQDLAASMC